MTEQQEPLSSTNDLPEQTNEIELLKHTLENQQPQVSKSTLTAMQNVIQRYQREIDNIRTTNNENMAKIEEFNKIKETYDLNLKKCSEQVKYLLTQNEVLSTRIKWCNDKLEAQKSKKLSTLMSRFINKKSIETQRVGGNRKQLRTTKRINKLHKSKTYRKKSKTYRKKSKTYRKKSKI